MQKLIDELENAEKHLQQEVSELKKKTAELETSLSLLRSTLESTAHGIVAVNLEGDVMNINQKFLDMWQIPDSLTLSQNSPQASLFFENQLKNPNSFRPFVGEVSSQPDFEGYNILELKDGRIFAQYSQPQWLGDRIIGRVWSIWDISDYKQVESKLRQTLQQVQQLREQRANFISQVCHQFRTPLNVVSFSNSLLKKHIDEWTKEKTQPLLDHIQTAVEKLSGMLNDVLLFANAEVAKPNFETEPLDLVRFCNELIAQIQKSSAHHINFVSEGSCGSVCIDEKLLEPILKNLLDNAFKYSASDSLVDLRLACESGKVIFQVTDRGVGIAVADRQRIFEPFYRGKNIKNIPGTGLGLPLVKTLVDLYGGEITVESEVDVGTTFTVMLLSVK